MSSRDRDVAVPRAGSDLRSPGYQVGGWILMRYAAPRPGLLVSFVVAARIVGDASQAAIGAALNMAAERCPARLERAHDAALGQDDRHGFGDNPPRRQADRHLHNADMTSGRDTSLTGLFQLQAEGGLVMQRCQTSPRLFW